MNEIAFSEPNNPERWTPDSYSPLRWQKKPLVHFLWLTYGQNEWDARITLQIQNRLHYEARFFAQR